MERTLISWKIAFDNTVSEERLLAMMSGKRRGKLGSEWNRWETREEDSLVRWWLSSHSGLLCDVHRIFMVRCFDEM